MTKAIHRPNFRSAAVRMRQATRIYRRLFEISSEPLIVWTPDLRVVDINDTLLEITGRHRDGVMGYQIDDAFPGNADDPSGDGLATITASLLKVGHTGVRDVMPVTRHDMLRPDGSFKEHYWTITNTAIRDDDGTLLAIVERAFDARGLVLPTAPPSASALDQMADTLIQAHRLNGEIGDTEVQAAIERALLRIGYRLAERDRRWLPPGVLN